MFSPELRLHQIYPERLSKVYADIEISLTVEHHREHMRGLTDSQQALEPQSNLSK